MTDGSFHDPTTTGMLYLVFFIIILVMWRIKDSIVAPEFCTLKVTYLILDIHGNTFLKESLDDMGMPISCCIMYAQ